MFHLTVFLVRTRVIETSFATTKTNNNVIQQQIKLVGQEQLSQAMMKPGGRRQSICELYETLCGCCYCESVLVELTRAYVGQGFSLTILEVVRMLQQVHTQTYMMHKL